MSRSTRRHLLSLNELGDEDFHFVLSRACHYAKGHDPAELSLRGAVVGIYFRKTSTRTRTAFSVAAQKLGASIVAYGPDDLQENTGETIEDTGRVLSGMLDGLVLRTAGDPEELRQMAGQDRMAVINAMTEDEHPTQAFADLCTVLTELDRGNAVRILYVGEGNNTASALALAMARLPGAELHLRTPPGYGLRDDKLKAAKATAEITGALIDERHDPRDLPVAIDVVYTTRWQTTGTVKADPDWRRVFAPFQVDAGLLAHYPGSVFMHDLPAHRGDEVTAEVLDGPQSIAFKQAENKLCSAMAVYDWCMGGA